MRIKNNLSYEQLIKLVVHLLISYRLSNLDSGDFAIDLVTFVYVFLAF